MRTGKYIQNHSSNFPLNWEHLLLSKYFAGSPSFLLQYIMWHSWHKPRVRSSEYHFLYASIPLTSLVPTLQLTRELVVTLPISFLFSNRTNIKVHWWNTNVFPKFISPSVHCSDTKFWEECLHYACTTSYTLRIIILT